MLRCGCNGSGRTCEVVSCGVCDVCHSETRGISPLERQTSVKFFYAETDTSGAEFQQS